MRDQTPEYKLAVGILATPVTIALIGAGVVYNAIVFKILWNWFIASQFNFPALSLAHAIGIWALVGSFARYIPKDDKDTKKFWIWEITAPAIALTTGWIAHLCM